VTERPRGPRTLGLVVVSLVVAAAALWAASRGSWWTVTWSDPLRGTVVARASGAEAEPVLVPWALLALAAVAGVLATAGWGRRVVGAVVALAGLVALWRGLAGLAAPGPAGLPAAARRAGTVAGVEVTVWWPLLAALGALVMTGAGVVVTWRAGELPRLGARYDAPAPGRTPGGSGASSGTGEQDRRPRRPADPDQELWQALDEGRDPTVEPGGASPPAASEVERGGRRGGRS
jgi:uncharacterized membrane protein (TIGR02234 family)